MKSSRKNRLNQALLALIGIYSFFWIGLEDRSLILPTILGILIAIAIGLNLGRWQAGVMISLPPMARYTLVGLISGSLAMPITVLAMLVKVSLHSHIPPDFTAIEVLEVLERTAVWSLAGLLFGLAFGLWSRLRDRSAR
jgi:hypothetical protein